jgi:hypothetical protein
MPSTLETRVHRLEESSGDGGGCERCRGTLVVVSNALTGELYSASWNGESLDEGEARKRQTETECPRCGQRIDPDVAPVIRVGGLSPKRKAG